MMGDLNIDRERRLQRLLEDAQADLDKREGGTAGARAVDTGDFTPKASPSGAQGFDLDLVDEARRQKTRAFVESQHPVIQFLMEAAPATIGTLAGMPGGIPGMVAGGLAGEQIAQETGVSPRGDIPLALSALGPIAGPLAGGTMKLSKKAVGGAVTILPPARAALSRNAARKAVDEMEDIATKIYVNKKGYIKFKASRLYDIAEKSGVRIPAFRTSATRAGMQKLRKELNRFSSFKEVQEALTLVDGVEEMLKGGSISFGDLISARKMIGSATDKAMTASKKLGNVRGAKAQLFKAIADDMDHLATLGGKTGRVAKIAQAAGQRAKLDFAVTDLRRGIATALEPIEGSNDVILNISKVRKWLLDVTNPDSKTFNKSMTEALADDIPQIKESLRKLSRFGKPGSAGGRGSLILRGKGAAAGAAIGGVIGGVPGSVVGTFLGAASPEMATAILSFGPAVRFLEKAAMLGEGAISKRSWAIAGQIAAQGAKFVDEERRSGLEVGAP